MRWRGRRQSEYVEDRRRFGGKKMVLGGGLGTIIIIILVWIFGGNPQEILQLLQPDTQTLQTTAESPGREDELGQFISVVLADTEDVWHRIFRNSGKIYREPTLVLYRGQVRSACGFA